MGVATGWRGADPNEVIRAADRAMYVDKHRNRSGAVDAEVHSEVDVSTVGPQRLRQLFERVGAD